MSNKDINIDFAINTRGQLVQYFVNPFNVFHGYIINGVRMKRAGYMFGPKSSASYKFTFLENTYRS